MKLEFELDPPGWDIRTGRERRYLVMAIDRELLEKTQHLIGHGSLESELRQQIEETIERFVRQQRIDIALPASARM
jgi:CRISPR/Cas system-associated endoribonuclease Cas2